MIVFPTDSDGVIDSLRFFFFGGGRGREALIA